MPPGRNPPPPPLTVLYKTPLSCKLPQTRDADHFTSRKRETIMSLKYVIRILFTRFAMALAAVMPGSAATAAEPAVQPSVAELATQLQATDAAMRLQAVEALAALWRSGSARRCEPGSSGQRRGCGSPRRGHRNAGAAGSGAGHGAARAGRPPGRRNGDSPRPDMGRRGSGARQLWPRGPAARNAGVEERIRCRLSRCPAGHRPPG